MSTARGWQRHWRLELILAGIILLVLVLYALRSVILPFVVGIVLAYLLLPVIKWVERKLPGKGGWAGFKRIVLILLIYILLFGAASVFAFYIISALIHSFIELVNNAPAYISSSIATVQQWLEFARGRFPPEVQQQVDGFIASIGNAIVTALRAVLLRGLSFIPTTFGLIFGFVILPVFLFFVLRDSERLMNSFYSTFSPRVRVHVKNIIGIVDKVLGRYIWAQLLLGAVVGAMAFIGLAVLGISLAPTLAAIAAVTELVPFIGPWIGGGIAVIVTLAIAPDKALWVAVVFLVVQLLENNLLVPRLQGALLRIHPAVAMVLIIIGSFIAGFWGMLLAVPLTATAIEIYKYFRQQIHAEQHLDMVPPGTLIPPPQ